MALHSATAKIKCFIPVCHCCNRQNSSLVKATPECPVLRQPGWFNLWQCLQAAGGGRDDSQSTYFLPPILHIMNTPMRNDGNSQEIKEIHIETSIQLKITKFPWNAWLSPSSIHLHRCQVLRQESACSSQALSLPSPQHLRCWEVPFGSLEAPRLPGYQG